MDKDTDKKLLKKVMTFKSGQFVFSRRFNAEELERPLIEARILCNTVADLPILPDLASSLNEELISRSIFGTAAIEGSPLSEENVAEILALPEGKEKLERNERETRNLKAVYDFVKDLKTSKSVSTLDEALIKQIHSIITNDVEHEHNAPGRYRNHLVRVGDAAHGGVYTPPKIREDIARLMSSFIEWLNSEELVTLGPILRGALAHYHLGLIHPFGDGNGRVARIVEALLMQLAGIKYVPVMLSNYYYQHIDDYLQVFSDSRKNKVHDVTPFLAFILQGNIEALNSIKGTITFLIRKFTLRSYYGHLRTRRTITQRQHDFLAVLLDHLGPFRLVDLYSVPLFMALYGGGRASERTARRDLRKLSENGLLLTNEDGYRINLQALEQD